MMIVIMLVIICTVMTTVFGFLIYARINDLEDELEWQYIKWSVDGLHVVPIDPRARARKAAQ